MKKTISFLAKNVWAVSLVLAAGLLLTSCLKDHDSTNGNNNNTSAGLMAFNLSPDHATVGFSIGGNSLTQQALAFNNYTGVYLPIYPGTRTVTSFDFASGDTLANISGTFELSKFYSVFLVGSGSSLENLLVRDNVDSLASSTQAFIRYIDAIPDGSASSISIATNGSDVVHEDASFKAVSQFVPITPGSVTVNVSNGGSINANRTITLEKQKVYTVLLIGQPGATGDNAVQVKYIENGTVGDSTSQKISSTSANRAIH